MYSTERIANRKKAISIIILLLVLVLIIGSVLKNSGSVVYSEIEGPYGFLGEGTVDSPYLISDKEDLYDLAIWVNGGDTFKDRYFRMTNDIDMDGVEMIPIGIFGGGYYFEGIFDGNGYRLSNLVINTGGNDGLFGMLGGIVRNLGIDSGYIGAETTGGCCGSIASHASSCTAKIINCYNRATVAGVRAGGIADNFEGSIINCWSDCELIGSQTGGITSYSESPGVQTFCYSTSALSGEGTSGEWFHNEQVSHEELYSQKMAHRLTANGLIWAETIAPIKQMNKWVYKNDRLTLQAEEHLSLFNPIDLIWLGIVSMDYYTWLMGISFLLVLSIAFSIWKYYSDSKKRKIGRA